MIYEGQIEPLAKVWELPVFDGRFVDDGKYRYHVRPLLRPDSEKVVVAISSWFANGYSSIHDKSASDKAFMPLSSHLCAREYISYLEGLKAVMDELSGPTLADRKVVTPLLGNYFKEYIAIGVCACPIMLAIQFKGDENSVQALEDALWLFPDFNKDGYVRFLETAWASLSGGESQGEWGRLSKEQRWRLQHAFVKASYSECSGDHSQVACSIIKDIHNQTKTDLDSPKILRQDLNACRRALILRGIADRASATQPAA